ncbi:hypothetical protein DFQ28_006046 [Apophysomyces sp. BC1034]|nr:hypothetical protein DFQ30_008236 [Apophysomyces sp. BC1015]KAG0176556.1 hypothetical protein DFQ29_005972 [Apophysomyces sp. BC1021]KAG0187642.1 hypothetical protein DFQ28_006046 [Apophysomyces sp. BC1034]
MSMPFYPHGDYQAPPAPYQTASPGSSSVLTNTSSILNHPNGLPPLQHHGLVEPNQSAVPQQQPPKRKQVKNACTNCQKACKKCDDARPCPRCVKYGIADSCVNSVRKERKRGIKRGPYKRRSKQEGEKGTPSRKSDSETQVSAPSAQGPYGSTIRAPSMPFGYPSNLNQYGQPYDPYGQYAAYHKDQMMPQQYVVNPYPPMAYLVAGNGGDSPGQPPQHYPALSQQHYNNMMHQQQQSPQTSRPMMHNDHVLHQQAQAYYQHQQKQPSQPTSQRSSPSLQDVKPVGLIKPQTPVPSASTSTNTASTPDSGEDEGSKFARLSQLCSAALNHTDSGRPDQSNPQ